MCHLIPCKLVYGALYVNQFTAQFKGDGDDTGNYVPILRFETPELSDAPSSNHHKSSRNEAFQIVRASQ
jgi:hypothetical protein